MVGIVCFDVLPLMRYLKSDRYPQGGFELLDTHDDLNLVRKQPRKDR